MKKVMKIGDKIIEELKIKKKGMRRKKEMEREVELMEMV